MTDIAEAGCMQPAACSRGDDAAHLSVGSIPDEQNSTVLRNLPCWRVTDASWHATWFI